jgi:hypothetical protein
VLLRKLLVLGLGLLLQSWLAQVQQQGHPQHTAGALQNLQVLVQTFGFVLHQMLRLRWPLLLLTQSQSWLTLRTLLPCWALLQVLCMSPLLVLGYFLPQCSRLYLLLPIFWQRHPNKFLLLLVVESLVRGQAQHFVCQKACMRFIMWLQLRKLYRWGGGWLPS